MPKKNFYAAIFSDGRHKLFTSWPDCQSATSGFSNVKMKGFEMKSEALAWIQSTDPKLAIDAPDTQVLSPLEGLLIYVDGSYEHAKCKRAGWAWVAVRDGKVIATDSGVTERDAVSRNIDGELEGAIRGMEWAFSSGQRATVCHDYTGIAMWATGAWRVKAEVSRAYVKRIKPIVGHFKFEKVTGHSGDTFNDLADKLAGEAIQTYLSRNHGT